MSEDSCQEQSHPTAESVTASRGRVRRWLRRLWITSKVMILLAVLGAIGYAVWINYAGNQAKQEVLRELRDRGLPTSVEAARDKWTPDDQGDNGAPYYKAAFELVEHIQGGPLIGRETEKPHMPGQLRHPIPDELGQTASSIVGKNPELFSLLKSAERYDYFRYGLDFTGPGSDNEILMQIRRAAYALRTLAVHYEFEGRPDDAARSYVSMLKMNQSLSNDAFLITCLVQNAVRSLAHGDIHRLLSRNALSSDSLNQLRRALARQSATPRVRRAIQFELVSLAEQIRHIHRYTASNVYALEQHVAKSGYSQSWTLPRINKDLSSEWEQIEWETSRLSIVGRRIFATLCPGWYKSHLAPEVEVHLYGARLANQPPRQLVQTLSENKKDSSEDEAIFSATQFFDASSSELMQSQLQSSLRHRAASRVVRTALAVENYRIEEGEWPTGPGDLAGRWAEDIYTDNLLKYRQMDDGVVIYSVGENKTDDGGVQEAIRGEDIAFRLFNPERRSTGRPNEGSN